MKAFFIAFFIISTSFSWAQVSPTKSEEDLVTYTETIEVPGVSKAELIDRAKNWLKQSPSAVSFISDEMGMISIGSEIPYAGSTINKKVSLEGRIVYVATIIIQDGVFMYEYNNFFHEANPNAPHAMDMGFLTAYEKNELNLESRWKEVVMSDLRRKVNEGLQKNIDSLKKIMLNEKSSLSLNLQSN